MVNAIREQHKSRSTGAFKKASWGPNTISSSLPRYRPFAFNWQVTGRLTQPVENNELERTLARLPQIANLLQPNFFRICQFRLAHPQISIGLVQPFLDTFQQVLK